MANVVEASSSADFDGARRLMRALVEWGRELSVEDRHLIDRYFDPAAFEAELAGLPGRYAPPTGRLLLARQDDRTVGCVAMRPLEPGVCEMKRMFIEPEYHGRGIGKALATRLIEEARASGYDLMRLDTSRHQAPAISLYEKLGFLRRSAYYDAPEGSEGFLLFFEKDLHAPPRAADPRRSLAFGPVIPYIAHASGCGRRNSHTKPAPAWASIRWRETAALLRGGLNR